MINFSNDLSNLPETCNDVNLCFDVSNSPSQIRKVYAYLVDSGLKDEYETEQSLYNLYIVSEAPIFAPADCSFMFSNFFNLEILNFNNNFNTSLTTSMKAMFAPVSLGGGAMSNIYTESRIMLLANEEDGKISFAPGLCDKIVKLDLSNFNTSNVIDMYGMFGGCSSLTSLDLSGFNTSKVKNMKAMFTYCESLDSLNLNNINTSNVVNMECMFSFCSSLIDLDLSNFNTSNVTDMSSMFFGCSSITNLDLNSFNTSQVTDMSYMFSGCSSLISLYLSNFNTSKVTDMSCMFSGCSFKSLNLSNFDTSKVTNMSRMFDGCRFINNLDISTFYIEDLSIISGSPFEYLTTTINYIGTSSFTFYYIQSGNITINYTSANESAVDQMIAKYPNFLIKGKLITAPSSN